VTATTELDDLEFNEYEEAVVRFPIP